MIAEFRTLGIWLAYATLLVGMFLGWTSFRGHPPTPPPPPPLRPALTATASTTKVGEVVTLRVDFRLDAPAGSDLEIPYRIDDGSAIRDRHYRISGEERLVIPRGSSGVGLVLTSIAPDTPGPGPALTRQQAVKVSIAPMDQAGYRIEGRMDLSWELPVTIVEPIPTSRLSLTSTGDFREPDARGREIREVVFTLGPPPVAVPISVGYRVLGNAVRKGEGKAPDYEVVDAPPSGRIVFRPDGGGRASLRLRRLPGGRGLGDRKIRVECFDPEGPVDLPDDGGRFVELVIPDRLPSISWEFDGPTADEALAPAGPTMVPIRFWISPPSSRPVEFRYRVSTDPGLVDRPGLVRFEPPIDPWSRDRQPQQDAIPAPGLRLAFRPDRSAVRERAVRVVADAASPNAPGPLERRYQAPVPRGIEGNVLVVLVLTAKVGVPEFDAIAELQKDPARGVNGPRLVDGTAFVLDASGLLSSFDRTTVGDLKRFEPGATLEKILGRGSRDIFSTVREKLSTQGQDRFEKAILIRDLVGQDPRALTEGLKNGLIGPGWNVFWLDPDADRKLEASLRRAFVDYTYEYSLSAPRSGLARALLEFLHK